MDRTPGLSDRRGQLRRCDSWYHDAETTDAILSFGDVRLDRSTYQLSTDTGTLRLANKEYQMLEMLMTNP